MADWKSKDELRAAQSSIPILTRIYVLKDPRDGAVRYVGKTTKTLKARLSQHKNRSSSSASTRSGRWINSLKVAGISPLIEQIDEAFGGWAARECFWISFFRDAGANLTNLTDGGEGAPGLKMTSEQRARVKAARTPLGVRIFLRRSGRFGPTR